MNATDYLQQLMALKPAGRAWPDDPDTRQNQTLAALAEELARIDARAGAVCRAGPAPGL